MSRLSNLSSDKMTIVEKILSSQGIQKALYYDSPDFLDRPDLTDPTELIMNKIYPYYRVPDSETDTSTYILVSFRNYRPISGQGYKVGYVNIFALTHKDLVATDYGFLRYDYIISEVDKILNNERVIGIGKLAFDRMDEATFLNDTFIGCVISYKQWEFN